SCHDVQQPMIPTHTAHTTRDRPLNATGQGRTLLPQPIHHPPHRDHRPNRDTRYNHKQTGLPRPDTQCLARNPKTRSIQSTDCDSRDLKNRPPSPRRRRFRLRGREVLAVTKQSPSLSDSATKNTATRRHLITASHRIRKRDRAKTEGGRQRESK